MNKKQLGILISELRRRNGLHQRELAEKLFVSTSAICKWENGINQPDTTTIIKLADILGVPNDALLHPEETLARLEAGEDILMPDTITEPDHIIDLIPEEPAPLPAESTEDTAVPSEQETTIPEPIIVPTSKRFTPVSLIGYACALVLFMILIIGSIGIYRYHHPTFTLITSEYRESTAQGTIYEMAVVCPRNVTQDALHKYTDIVFDEWLTDKYASDVSTIQVYFYPDRDTASQWGESITTITLVK